MASIVSERRPSTGVGSRSAIAVPTTPTMPSAAPVVIAGAIIADRPSASRTKRATSQPTSGMP